MEELKPCPFCGGEAVEEWRYGGLRTGNRKFYFQYIVCEECGAKSRATSTEEDPNDFNNSGYKVARTWWNRRVNDGRTD